MMSKYLKEAELIKESGLFDEDWYRSEYPDVDILGMDPLIHFLWVGSRLGRDPGPKFSARSYLSANPDVAQKGYNPLLHYVRYGKQEGRLTTNGPTEPKIEKVVGEFLNSPLFKKRLGRRAFRSGRPTALVCAHVVGATLFGSERSFLDILDGLSALEYNIVVSLPTDRNETYLDAVRERSNDVCIFPYKWWRSGVSVSEADISAFCSIIHEYSIDFVYANTIVIREPLVAARRLGVPAIVHVRELVTHDPDLCQVVGKSAEEIVQQVLSSCDFVIGNSNTTAEVFFGGVPTGVVPNTVDASDLDLPPPEPDATVRIALISSNIPKKGIWDAVECAQILKDELPDVKFLLIGPETDATRKISEGIRAGEISDRIVLSGYRDSPAKAMEEADVVLNLSHFSESFGRTILEAMFASRPVIVYKWGALPELVEHGRTGFIVPYKDTAAVAECIRKLVQNRTLLQDMGEAGRRRAIANFGKQSYILALKNALDTFFSQWSPPRHRVVLPARSGESGASQDQKLRIAYFLWHFPVPSETFVLNELRVLVEKKYDVKVFCKQSPYPEFQPDFEIEWQKVDSPQDLARRLAETKRTVVHSHFVYPTVTEMVWPACEEAKLPFTFIAHSQDIFRYINDAKNNISVVSQSKWCKRVFVPSSFHYSFLLDRGVSGEKMALIPNGIDPEYYKCSVRENNNGRRICAVHRFTEKKGLEQLIRAAPLLEEIGVSVYLYGYGELESEYIDIIESNGINNVYINGPVADRDGLLEVFSQSDLFMCPSVRAADGDMDGIPTVLMEAMASGIPVMATAISGIPDLVKDGVTGFRCGGTPEQIAACVRRFYDTPADVVEIVVEEARKHIANHYATPQLVDTMLQIWSNKLFDVLIVSWNNAAEMREIIRRLYNYSTLPFHLVVCDNGSDSEGIAQLCRLYAEKENVTVILNRKNLFVGPGTNICLSHCSSEYAVYVCGKEGFVLKHGWDKVLIQYMESNPLVGLAGTICHSPTYLYGRQYADGIDKFPQFRNQWFANANPDRLFGHVQGGFFAIRREMFEQIGGFNDRVPHSYTDVEYSYYAESCGWELGRAPSLLSLFNKTRPGLAARIDESVMAAHPPTLADLPWLDGVVAGSLRHCNVCEVNTEMDGYDECPSCSASAHDRSLYRYLAESTLLYRRLPALGVNVSAALRPFWQQQFQGPVLSLSELSDRLKCESQLEVRDGRLSLVYINLTRDSALDSVLIGEIYRVLSADGVLLLGGEVTRGSAEKILQETGLIVKESIQFASAAVRFDGRQILAIRKIVPH